MAEATGETNREDWRELDHLVPAFQTRASKLRPARAHLELVERTALVGALLGSQASLVLVSAPAGYGKSTLLAQWADAAPVATSWLQLDATDNDPVVFLTYLTAAERRVLDLLTTQLSAPQIAARLFLSGNTVKTHMSHLYAKLGVTTRTDAVERARELGLLRPPEQS